MIENLHADETSLTLKQREILETAMKGDGAGGFIDLDQLIEDLPYATSKQSMQFSIRALVKRRLLEKKPREVRRGRKRAIYALTPAGYSLMQPAPMPSGIPTAI